MKPLPLQDRFAAGLCYEESKPTTHYRVFKKPGQTTFYLGKSGALRYSGTHKVTQAFAAGPWMREQLLNQPGVPTHTHHGKLYRNGVPEVLP